MLTLQYSTTGASGSSIGVGSGFDFSSPITSGTVGLRDGNAAGNRVAGIGGTFTPGAQIANGASFYFRWADPDDGSADNALAIDNFSLSLSLVPEPSTWLGGALALVTLGYMQRRRLCNTLKR